MYFILREEDTSLERWKAGLISSSSKKTGTEDKWRARCEEVRCYKEQLRWVSEAGRWFVCKP